MTSRFSLQDTTSNGESGVLRGRKFPHSPLTVISGFFGLVELGLAYSSGVSSGWLQIAVLTFMALFASGIAGAFFFFLWHRNWVFYPPSEFLNVPVEDYVNAMRDRSTRLVGIAAESVSRVFEDKTLPGKLDLTEVREEQREAALRQIADELRTEAIRNVEKRVLRIDARPLIGEGAPQWEEPYDAELSVHRLIDKIWFQLQPMPPHPYGTIWSLKDASSGRVFVDIGPAWAKRMGTLRDKRFAKDVGIVGGMTLEVIRIEK